MFYKNLVKALPLFLLVSFMFVACDNGDDSLSPSTNSDLASADFAVLDYDDVIDGMIEPDIDNDPGFGQFPPNPEFLMGDGIGGRRGNPMMNNGQRPRPHQRGRHLGEVFRHLNLSDDQLEAIKPFLEAHKVEMTALHEELKTATEDIMEYGREQRQAIVQQVKDGTITREEAKPLFEALGEEIRGMMDANEAAQTIKAEMCAAAETLFVNITSLFTEEQLELWNQWIADHPSPCAG
ncbi:MAG: hypothetical protein KKA84_07215 [Bacteroidetes bacterium]|nr:hypothetical protein [Bacteroidota bacterium]